MLVFFFVLTTRRANNITLTGSAGGGKLRNERACTAHASRELQRRTTTTAHVDLTRVRFDARRHNEELQIDRARLRDRPHQRTKLNNSENEIKQN